MKKLHVVCTVAILALAAMVLIGCDQPTSNPGNNPSNSSDSWTKVETVDGLEGVWKSSVTQAFSGNQITVVTTITYPTTEGKLRWAFEVKDMPDSEEKLFPKDTIGTVLKNGQIPVSIFPIVGYMEVNADKTKLKVTATLKEGDENWGDVKKFVGMGTFEGDMKITSEPTQITVEQYYNKQ